MRETEYRAWIIEQKRMVWVAGLCFDDPTKVEVPRIGNEHMQPGKAMYDNPQNYEFWYEGKEAILMRHVGLKDKNDKRIYAGDILWCKCKIDKFGENNKRNTFHRNNVIEWYQSYVNHGYRLRDGRGKTLHKIHQSHITSMEAERIGNIHQNPGLLKEQP